MADALPAARDRAAASARCGLWELDLGTGAIWVTPETREIYGVAADQTTDYDLLMRLIHEADREAVAAAIGKAMAERSQFDETYRIVRPDGAVRWIHVTGKARGGNKLLGASVDVTEQVEASEPASILPPGDGTWQPPAVQSVNLSAAAARRNPQGEAR